MKDRKLLQEAIDKLREADPELAARLVAASSKRGAMGGLWSPVQLAEQTRCGVSTIARLVQDGTLVPTVSAGGKVGGTEAWLPTQGPMVRRAVVTDWLLDSVTTLAGAAWPKLELGMEVAVSAGPGPVFEPTPGTDGCHVVFVPNTGAAGKAAKEIKRLQRFLTRQEAANAAGMSMWTLRKWVDSGVVAPSVRQAGATIERWKPAAVGALAGVVAIARLGGENRSSCVAAAAGREMRSVIVMGPSGRPQLMSAHRASRLVIQ